MKNVLLFAVLAALTALSGCATYQGVKTDLGSATASATPAPDPVKSQALLDKLINVDGPAAIATAQKEVDNAKTPAAEKVYAQKRIVCYQTIVEIAPDFQLLNLPIPAESTESGVLYHFEIAAETAEGLATVIKVGLPTVDVAKFETSCGWIGQRGRAIVGVLGLRGAGFFVP